MIGLGQAFSHQCVNGVDDEHQSQHPKRDPLADHIQQKHPERHTRDGRRHNLPYFAQGELLAETDQQDDFQKDGAQGKQR